MKLQVNDIEVECVIGDRPNERERPQRLRVDAELELPESAFVDDRLDATVDYVAVAEAIRSTLVDARCRMVEHAAYLAARACRGFHGVLGAEVRVVKVGAVSGIGSVAAVATA